MIPILETKYVFTITARIGDVVTAGETGIGVRRIIPIIGGEVTGAISGKVLPFGADFQNSAELFAEGLEILWRAWTERGRWSHKGRFYQFENIEVRPRPMQSPTTMRRATSPVSR